MSEKKVIVGILSTLKENSSHPYDTVYKIVDAYVKKIEEIGFIPVGIIDVENNLDILDVCDAFLLPGGNKIIKDHYYIIRHCIERNKPMIGICLGFQAMVFYDFFWTKFGLESIKKIDEFKNSDIKILNSLDSNTITHGGILSSDMIEGTLENILQSKHSISIKKDSILYEIYKKEQIDVISMHKYGVYDEVGSYFKGIAYSSDGVLEAISYKDSDYFIIGVQYHPEIVDDLLFDAFKEQILKRK